MWKRNRWPWVRMGKLMPEKYDSPVLSTYGRKRRPQGDPVLMSGRIFRRWWWFVLKPFWRDRSKPRVTT